MAIQPGGPVDDEFALVIEANTWRLRWLESARRRCFGTGSTLYLALTYAGYQTGYSTMFRFRLGHLLGAHTDATLLVLYDENPLDRNRATASGDLSAPREVEVCLYRNGALLAKTDVAVETVMGDVKSLVDGPFLEHA